VFNNQTPPTPGGDRRLHLHQQRARPREPGSPGQDGEFLPGGDPEVSLPALLQRHGAAPSGPVRVQHGGPPAPHLALATQVTGAAAPGTNVELKQNKQTNCWNS